MFVIHDADCLLGFITVNIGIVVLGKGVISLDSDSEDTPGAGAETSNKYGPISLEQPCRLEPLTSDSDSGEESFYLCYYNNDMLRNSRVINHLLIDLFLLDNSTDWLRGPSSQSSLPKVAIEVTLYLPLLKKENVCLCLLFY